MTKLDVNDDFYAGVLTSLAVVYAFDQEVIAEEIVAQNVLADLLAVAKRTESPEFVVKLRATMRTLKARGMKR